MVLRVFEIFSKRQEKDRERTHTDTFCWRHVNMQISALAPGSHHGSGRRPCYACLFLHTWKNISKCNINGTQHCHSTQRIFSVNAKLLSTAERMTYGLEVETLWNVPGTSAKLPPLQMLQALRLKMLKEFLKMFSQVTTQYMSSFLPQTSSSFPLAVRKKRSKRWALPVALDTVAQWRSSTSLWTSRKCKMKRIEKNEKTWS